MMLLFLFACLFVYRQFESQIEGLRRSSSLHTPLYLTTPPPEQSQ